MKNRKNEWVWMAVAGLFLISTVLFGLSSCADINTTPGSAWQENHYLLHYASNGDGTCALTQIETIPSETVDFQVVIPEMSPDGDAVTAVCLGGKISAYGNIPFVLREEEFDAIEEKLKETYPENHHEVARTKAFYGRFDVSEMTPKGVTETIAKYPICEFLTIYVMDESITLEEMQFLNEIFAGIGYTDEDVWSECQAIRNEVEACISKNSRPFTYQGKEDVDHDEMKKYYDTILEAMPVYSCSSHIVSVSLPDTVRVIGKNSFSKFPVLETVHFGTDLETIEGEVFSSCPCLKSVELGDNVKTLGDRAFGFDSSLLNAELGKQTESVGDGAFYTREEVNAVQPVIHVGKSLRSMGSLAFFNTCVCYDGTPEEWAAIIREGEKEADNEKTFVYFYSETEPSDDGNLYWHWVDDKPTYWN